MTDFLDAQEIGKAHLVGHSLGGAVALCLALDHADWVASATLVCSAGLGPEINMEYIDGFMQAKAKALEPVLAMLVADPDMVSRRDDRGRLFKRLDGVEAALNRIIHDNFAGGRQTLELTPRLGEPQRPGAGGSGAGRTGSFQGHAESLLANVPVRASVTPATWSIWRRPPRSTS